MILTIFESIFEAMLILYFDDIMKMTEFSAKCATD